MSCNSKNRSSIISIHTPRVGRDLALHNLPDGQRLFQSTRPVWGVTFIVLFHKAGFLFQSTRPVWGVTSVIRENSTMLEISIHTPRVGRD